MDSTRELKKSRHPRRIHDDGICLLERDAAMGKYASRNKKSAGAFGLASSASVVMASGGQQHLQLTLGDPLATTTLASSGLFFSPAKLSYRAPAF
jgi:hypothetical protein